MKDLFLLPHLGLGDILICNALVRHLAHAHTEVVVPVKPRNRITAAFMWRDQPRIQVIDAEDDREALGMLREVRAHNRKTLAIGLHATPPSIKLSPLPQSGWDAQLYKDAGVAFSKCWSDFKVDRQPSMELRAPEEPFCLVHDDAERGFKIDHRKLPKKLKIVRVDPTLHNNLFAWWGHIEKCEQFHGIESSVAILMDHMPVRHAKRLVLHTYSRKSTPPKYMADWEVVE